MTKTQAEILHIYLTHTYSHLNCQVSLIIINNKSHISFRLWRIFCFIGNFVCTVKNIAIKMWQFIGYMFCYNNNKFLGVMFDYLAVILFNQIIEWFSVNQSVLVWHFASITTIWKEHYSLFWFIASNSFETCIFICCIWQ